MGDIFIVVGFSCSSRAHFLARRRTLWGLFPQLRCCAQMISNANRVEDRTREREQPPAALQTSEFDFPHWSNGFIPPEDFLDPLAFAQTFLVFFVPRRSLINATAARTACVLRRMQRHTLAAHRCTKRTDVIRLIAAERETFLRNILL